MSRNREALSLTAELVARVERLEPDPGPLPGTREMTEAEYDAMAEAVLAEAPPGPLWLFAYGSLIWNPELDGLVEEHRATAPGRHRSFCLRLARWRGTHELPALMLALDRGGSCKGVAYRLADENRYEQVRKLLVREIDDHPPTNVPRFIPVRLAGKQIIALTFVADRNGPAYDGGRSDSEVAHILAHAAGHWGSAAAYLQRTVEMLEKHNIRDRNLWTIQKLVADEIMSFTRSG